jgi:hypothetical protein
MMTAVASFGSGIGLRRRRRTLRARQTRLAPALAVFGLALLGASSASPVPDGRDFGRGVTLTSETALASLLESPEAFEEEPVLVRGRIADVCQKKGCWTVLRDGDASVRVRFEDYGFFLPKDVQGREAWVEGVVTVRTLSEGEARHYEAESRQGDPDAIHGPQREVGFVASGVRVVPAH